MKILIAGTGDTATHLAKMLSREDQDVVVMGRDTNVLLELDQRYNLLTYEGNPVVPSHLRQAGASGCNLFIAVTPFENHNLVSSEIAKWLGAQRTLARIDNGELLNEDIHDHFVNIGVDEMVYPEYLASHEINRALEHPWLKAIYPLHSGAVTVGAVRVQPGAPISGTVLRDFDKEHYKMHICAIKRDGMTIIPGGNDTIESYDIVYFTTAKNPDEHEIMHLFGKHGRQIKSVMIIGAGKMTEAVINLIAGKYSVTVIEPDRSLCDKIASRCDGVTVVCADFRDVDILREEGIRNFDALISLSDSSEKNIVCSMVGRTLGVPFTIAQIEDIQYFSEADDLNIDVVINKKLLTSSTIYQMLLDSYIESARCLAFEDAEVAEIVAGERSVITRKPVRELHLDKSMTIAAVIHNGVGRIVDGNTWILPGDHVVVFCLRGHMKHIEKLFS